MKFTKNSSVLSSFFIGLFIIISTSLLAQSQATINPAAAGLSAERLARLDAFLDGEIVAGKIPGAVSLIYRKGAIAQYKTHGYTNLATKEKMELDEIFYIQSMTKPVVSVALMLSLIHI